MVVVGLWQLNCQFVFIVNFLENNMTETKIWKKFKNDVWPALIFMNSMIIPFAAVLQDIGKDLPCLLQIIWLNKPVYVCMTIVNYNVPCTYFIMITWWKNYCSALQIASAIEFLQKQIYMKISDVMTGLISQTTLTTTQTIIPTIILFLASSKIKW